MIRMKDVMERLDHSDAMHDTMKTDLRGVEVGMAQLEARVIDVSSRISKLMDEVCRLEASLAMWQRKFEKTLIKEDE